MIEPGDLVCVHASGIETEPALLALVDPILGRACLVQSISNDAADLVPFPESQAEPTRGVPLDMLLPVHPEVVPKKHAGRRAVVYLDQCVLSELVKVRSGRLHGANQDAAQQLALALDDAVLRAQAAICVESWFHRQESIGFTSGQRGSPDLFQAAFEYLCLRSRHLRLLEHFEILRHQVLQRVALNTNGFVLPAHQLWKTGLSRDPEQTNEATGVFGGAIVVGVPWGAVEPPPKVAQVLERDRASGQLGNFQSEMTECVRLWRAGALRAHRLSPWRQWGRRREFVSDEVVAEFICSAQFNELPYVHCATTLTASLLSERARRFRDGDYVDLRFASRALPYCDLMVVDADLCNRIRSLKLDSRYEVNVLPAKLQGYSDAALWLQRRVALRDSA